MSAQEADTLVKFVVKSVGKREFLKSVNRLFPRTSKSDTKGEQVDKPVPTPVENQCEARVKGERTGIKAGRHVLFDAQQCARKDTSRLCCIHKNQVKKQKFNLGYVNDPLTDAQKKVFGELD